MGSAAARADWDTLGTQQSLGAGITPGMATDSQGKIHLVYMTGGRIYYRLGTPAGVFGPTEEIPYPAGTGTGTYNSPHVIVDANDIPHVAFEKDFIGSSKKAWYTNRIGGTWKSPVTAIDMTGITNGRVNYPRLAVSGDYACVCSLVTDSSEICHGKIAMLNNLASSPTVTHIRDTVYWQPDPVFTSQGYLYVTGRNGTLGHYIQRYDLDLNTVGSERKISIGTPSKTGESAAAVVDKNDVIHAAGVTWESDQRLIWYNNTQRLDQGKSSICGLLVPVGYELGERHYPTMTIDACGTVYVAYYDCETGGAKASIVVGDSFATPVAFAPSMTVRLRWNPHMAPGLSGGVYAAWDDNNGESMFLRSIGLVTTPPTKASNPTPSDGATGLALTGTTLNWTAGTSATSHNVYWGTTSPGTFRGNQAGTIYDPGALQRNIAYYWRIDEVNSNGTTTGDIWHFTTRSWPGDMDADNDVDQVDFGAFQSCYSGHGVVYAAGCELADLDGDGNVDVGDFDLFQRCMSGANVPVSLDCGD